jgi:chemotaxis protein methyltransferase CheR
MWGKESLNQYFVSDGQNQLSAQTLKDILFSRHNLVTDGVFKECQLILCRNVLIYFNEDLQNKVLELFLSKFTNTWFFSLEIRRHLGLVPFMINLKL